MLSVKEEGINLSLFYLDINLAKHEDTSRSLFIYHLVSLYG